ncbi:DUF721 domain-containing protein [Roseiconus nitratireducens]|uniref:DUF721 domain-containing protein n=1 Tax=Roseiconus nitratireducens TaxID=2605748 RepID=A0A5M6D5Q2_9BACT|nr:DUF721 domain-containing protein [Roseiconus nitratireducens]KAA5541109.1 DUF721 domain-containing protein [Roseiconus nitratireducens]
MDSDRRKVQSIGSLVGQLLSRRGYAQVAATDEFRNVISTVVGRDLSEQITVGKLNQGVLAVFATDSVTIQELTFQKRAILKRMHQDLPDCKVQDLRFKIQAR